jgi:integrase
MARRGHGEGTIFQRWTTRVKVDGKQVTLCGKSLEEVHQKLTARGIDINKASVSMTWVAQATTGRDFETGKPKRSTFYGDTRKEAAEQLSAALHDVQNGTFVEPTKITFATWLDTWLKEYAKQDVRPTTYDSYEYQIRIHIKPGLGGTYLKDLQPNQIQKFYNQKLKEALMDRRSEKTKEKELEKIKQGKAEKREEKLLSSATIRRMHIIINEALDQALKEGKIIRNPAKATKPPKMEKKEARYSTPEELSRFLDDISDDYWCPAYFTDANSGLRLGELVALKWSRIDLEKGGIYVKEAVSRIREDNTWKLYFHPPKSKKGLRYVPIPSEAVEVLKRLKKRQAEEKMKLGKAYLGDGEKHDLKQDQWFVFTWPDGRMVDPFYLSKHFLMLTRKHNLSVNFHGLRHSYATALLQEGEHPKVVQELLGDSTISVVLDTYSHVIPALKERAASKLEGLFTNKKPSSAKEG